MIKIGDTWAEDESPEIFELVIQDHVDKLNPKAFGNHNEKIIDPLDYYTTSGDAVQKALSLEADLITLADKYSTSDRKGNSDLSKKAYELAGKTRSLIKKLELARGPAYFLEIEWTPARILVCVPKNPRKK